MPILKMNLTLPICLRVDISISKKMIILKYFCLEKQMVFGRSFDFCVNLFFFFLVIFYALQKYEIKSDKTIKTLSLQYMLLLKAHFFKSQYTSICQVSIVDV